MKPSSGMVANRNRSVAEVSGDGTVLLDLAGDRLLKLNAVAAEMWKLLSTGGSEAQIIDIIVGRYGIDS